MEQEKLMAENVAYNIDCMEYMKTLPDKAFDLAVVDPPYGDAKIGGATGPSRLRFHGGDRWDRYISSPPHTVERTGGTWAAKYGKKIVAWDFAPEKEYFDELFRVSRNQIIWGGNYFELPPTRCFLVLRKRNIPENFSMAMCEYAWTSFDANAKIFECNMQGQPNRFHPTQKPIELYRWILHNYAERGDKILDTHLGSGSSRIAAWELGFDFVGCEIDKPYFDKQEERFNEYTAQLNLFIDTGRYGVNADRKADIEKGAGRIWERGSNAGLH